jgi:hypothetical protein
MIDIEHLNIVVVFVFIICFFMMRCFKIFKNNNRRSNNATNTKEKRKPH